MTISTDNTPRDRHFVVWHHMEGPVSPLLTFDDARRQLVEVHGGRLGLEVRQVTVSDRPEPLTQQQWRAGYGWIQQEQWRASCEACAWSTTTATYAAAGDAARGHGDTCPEASTTVEVDDGRHELVCEPCAPAMDDAFRAGLRAGASARGCVMSASVWFDGQRYQTRHLAAQVDAGSDVLPALLTMAARRRFGRQARVYRARHDSAAMDGSHYVLEFTVDHRPHRQALRRHPGPVDVGQRAP